MSRPANRLRTLSVFIAARREALRYAMQNYGHFEMEDPTWMPGEPGFDLGIFVGAVIVEDGMDQLPGRDRALDGIEKADELLMGMALHTAAEDTAIERVEGGKQGGCAVALVIMSHGAAAAGF